MAKRRRRRSHRRRRLFNRNPRRVRRFRRNPIGSTQSFLGETFVPAAIGAAGAVGTDLLLGSLPIPMFWRSGPGTQTAIRMLASLGVGWLVGAISTERRGAEAAAGGIVVSLYQLFRPWAAMNLPFRMARYVPMGAMFAKRPGGMRRYVAMRGIRRGGPANLQNTNGPTRLRNRAGMGLRGLKGRMGAFANPARTSGPYGGQRVGRAMARYIAHQNQ